MADTDPRSDDWTHGEVVRALRRIEQNQTATNARLDVLSAGYVTRAEWEIHREALGREVRELKDARAPWWQVGGLILTGIGTVIAIILATT